jgi:hypothetical protein
MMRPIDDKAKDGNWIAISRNRPIDAHDCCPFVLVRWVTDFVEDPQFGIFEDGHGNCYSDDEVAGYWKLI